MTNTSPTVTDMRMASAMLNLKQFFPELTEKQFHVAATYAMGRSVSRTSSINNRNYEATKKMLQRCKEALNVDSIESIRTIFIFRTLWGIYEKQ